MKVTLAQHGGLAAGIRQPPRVVDSTSLPEEPAKELARLVAATRGIPDPAGDKLERARDAMSYTLTVEDDDGERTIMRQSDVDMTTPFASLIDWLRRHGARGE